MIKAVLTCLCFPSVILYQIIKALHHAANKPRKKRPKQTIIIKTQKPQAKPQSKPPATLSTARDQARKEKEKAAAREKLRKAAAENRLAAIDLKLYYPLMDEYQAQLEGLIPGSKKHTQLLKQLNAAERKVEKAETTQSKYKRLYKEYSAKYGRPE